MTRYCAVCGCPRKPTSLDPCPDCGDWPFSEVPNIQHTGEAGWLARGGEYKPEPEVVQGELFESKGATP